MNRFNLPDVSFLEKDPQLIESDLLSYIQGKTDITLSNADPRRKFIQGLVLYIAQERNNLDYALKQNLLAYADGAFLDHSGEGALTPRLGDQAAVTTMELALEEDRVSVLIIEKGTRFLVGKNAFFATEETIAVPVGQHTVQIKAYCTEKGGVGNGYLPGEITMLVQPLAWVKRVRNVTISAGGVDVEEDDPYAERIRIAPESFSVAGPEGAYEYWAKRASQDIGDVKVWSPSEGTVDIRVLLKNGELPAQEILDKVLAACSDKENRPLTDKVIVSAPEQVPYDISAQYWVLASNVTVLDSIQQKVERAFQEYLNWQRSKMGRDIDLSELITRLKQAGAHRVAVDSIMFVGIEKYQVAKEENVVLSFGGLADE
ncbi:baseplate assembly protein [Desulfitobacterium chlororespirans]|uniref:Phage-related baseplate assembly protein n=1 Tax=Desulfitobacterium chlororespirans DSM 11544 TaxID=1121395 RepID=A0A1M7U2J5_9FIRM|nr:baseplate J/gp47 family protein [Desulfitobacterium chlororespirans]SHN77178.1 Phage-related baseplate assembly protein [Desulfitobacterium chlororespirans DSM 11544]